MFCFIFYVIEERERGEEEKMNTAVIISRKWFIR